MPLTSSRGRSFWRILASFALVLLATAPSRPALAAEAASTLPSAAIGRAHSPASTQPLAPSPAPLSIPVPPGGELITYVNTSGVGRVAVRVELPFSPRYPQGAPVVVEASTWFVDFTGFHRVNDTTLIGAIAVSYLWPGRYAPEYGVSSEGSDTHGGPEALLVLRDVIRFASGLMPDVDGHYLDQLIAMTPLFSNVGMFASSHAGVVATNVVAYHGADLPRLKYLVGRENPTRDEMYPLELGYFDDHHQPVNNPYYDEDAYHQTTLTVDYSTVGWYTASGPGRPYWAGQPGFPEFVVHPEIHPTLWGKWYYSRALTQALLDNGALTLEDWPAYLAKPAETQAAWPYRITVHNYPKLATAAPNLKVMLVFAKDDHVQTAATKPHIHQAWDGFTTAAGLWVRLNPDLAYVQSINPGLGAGFPDNAANAEPNDWHNIRQWAYPSFGPGIREDVWLASVAEMADRVQANNWSNNLDAVLFDYTPPEQWYLCLPLCSSDALLS